MIKRRIFYILLLIALVFAEVYINNKYSLILLLAAIVLPVISVLFARYSKDAFSVRLSAPDAIVRGESAEIKVILENTSGAAVANVSAVLDVTNSLTGGTAELPFSSSIAGKSTQECVLNLGGCDVGNITVTVCRTRVYDMFRLVSFPVDRTDRALIFVLPAEQPFGVSMTEVNEVEGESVRFSEHLPGNDISEVFDVRDYVIGDDVRKIHWKLSGKLDRTIVREFSRPQNFSFIIITDLLKSTPKQIDRCVSYVSDLSRTLLENGIMHTLIWFDSGTNEYLTYNITSFEEHDNVILRLVSSSCYEGEAEAISRFAADIRHNAESTVIYVSPSVDREKTDRISLYRPIKVIEIREGTNPEWSLRL